MGDGVTAKTASPSRSSSAWTSVSENTFRPQTARNWPAGALVVVSTDWAEVINVAERISAQHTIVGGHCFLDALHVATALHLGAVEFLSCDANQRKLAATEALAAKP